MTHAMVGRQVETCDSRFSRLPQAVWAALACPQCGGNLAKTATGMRCSDCHNLFDDTHDGNADLRIRSPKCYPVNYQIGGELLPVGFRFAPLEIKPNPAVDFSQISPPWHLSRALLSYFPKAKSTKSVALDLGCGTGLHREVCEHAGFQWAGLDYANPQAPILGDGHALPFRSNSVELVVSLAVLEHIRHPSVVAREVIRVLAPGCCFIGTVAFLEPFHGDSFYHHTHLGTFNTLQSAGFDVIRVAPIRNWSGMRAQATMSLFPRLPGPLVTTLIGPVEGLHKLWWRLGRLFSPAASELSRQLANAGSFEFVARKPAG